ncbi:MAG: thiamine phosphate synthase [bacterium]
MYKNIYPIINISDNNVLNEELVIKSLTLDPKYMQLRMKKGSVEEIVALSKQVVLLRDKFNPKTKIIVNDSVDAALLSGADGVHLGQTDNILCGLKRKRDNFIVGYSTHTVDEVIAANSMPVDYIGFGPVFKTKTKIQSYLEVYQFVDEVPALSLHPVVFIGGIDENNIKLLPKGDKIFYAMIGALDKILK